MFVDVSSINPPPPFLHCFLLSLTLSSLFVCTLLLFFPAPSGMEGGREGGMAMLFIEANLIFRLRHSLVFMYSALSYFLG